MLGSGPILLGLFAHRGMSANSTALSMSSNSKLDGEHDTERAAELADLIVWKHILPLLIMMVATFYSGR